MSGSFGSFGSLRVPPMEARRVLLVVSGDRRLGLRWGILGHGSARRRVGCLVGDRGGSSFGFPCLEIGEQLLLAKPRALASVRLVAPGDLASFHHGQVYGSFVCTPRGGG